MDATSLTTNEPVPADPALAAPATVSPPRPWYKKTLAFRTARFSYRLMRRALAKLAAVRRNILILPRKLRQQILPDSFLVYFRNLTQRLTGRQAMQLRLQLAQQGPSPMEPAGQRPLRVLQGLYATVQPALLHHAFTRLGLSTRYETFDHNPAFPAPSTVYNHLQHPDLYFEHAHFDRQTLLPLRPGMTDDWSLDRLVQLFQEKRRAYDVFHFNWFLSYLPDNADVEFLRQDGRLVYFHFRGCFILSQFVGDRFTKNGGTVADACAHCKKVGWRDQYFARFHRAVRGANRVFVSTPNLCHCSPEFEFLPLSLDPELAQAPFPPEKTASGTVLILHCVGGPSHYAVKGTDHIRRAVATLQKEGLPVELKIIEKMSRADAVKLMAQGDVLVEQLNLGAYGNVAIEAMALGVPVISSLDPQVAHLTPDCPIVHADPTTVVARLRELVRDPARRRDLARRCYDWVRSFHDNDRIAAHAHGLYRVDLGLDRLRPANNLANREPNYA